MLGSHLVRTGRDRYDIQASYCQTEPFTEGNFVRVNLHDSSQVSDVLCRFDPEVVVHTAALTQVDLCEMKPEMAHRVNVEATDFLAKAARKCRCHFVYISTDQVYDGRESGYYEEGHKVHPLNVYAKTKLEGEQITASTSASHLILRTNFFGFSDRPATSFAEWVWRSFESGESVPMFPDVYFTPLYVQNLVDAIFELIDSQESGLFHLAAPKKVSKLEYGRLFADVFGFRRAQARSVAYEPGQGKAERPLNASLSSEKARSILQTGLLDVRDGISRMKADGEGLRK